MALRTSVRSTDVWTITAQGRDDLASCPTCTCHVRIVGLLVECSECGTVYGTLKELGEGRGPAPEKRR